MEENGGNGIECFKMGKRIIAVTMAAAVIVSGIVFSSDKKIKAADTEPQVKVLGATILKEEAADEKRQSILLYRLLIQNYVEMCGIEVSVEEAQKARFLYRQIMQAKKDIQPS